MTPKVLVQSGEPELQETHLALSDLGRNDGRRRQEVAGAQRQEDESDARHVPSRVIPIARVEKIHSTLG